MNTVNKLMYEWKTLPWKGIERQVFKLQTRIYRVSQRGDVKAVHRLQRLLLKSWSAKCLATRRVTQDNQGKKTAGIDGVKALTAEQRLELVKRINLNLPAQPVRRVWIPKPNSQERRPLGIPVMADRALQTTAKLALEPQWEAHFEANSYGFRPGRSAHDALTAIRNSIMLKPKYVLDADIAKCFDKIDHHALLTKLNTFPVLRRLIDSCLKAGILDGETFLESALVHRKAVLARRCGQTSPGVRSGAKILSLQCDYEWLSIHILTLAYQKDKHFRYGQPPEDRARRARDADPQ